MAITTFVASQILTAAQMNAVQGNDYNQTVSTKTASYTLVAADKGTRIVMNVTGASTVTVNTSLFSAGDTLSIQNISATACTVTAGTATVSSAGPLAIPQNGSGLLYFTSAGVSIFYPSAVTGTSAPVSNRVVRTSGNVTTTSTSLVDVTGATITLTTGTNRLAYGVAQSLSTLVTGNFFNFNIDLDGTLLHGTSGIKFVDPNAPTNFNGSFSGLSDTLSAGSHTIKLQFMVNTGTGTIVATTAIAQMFYAYEIA